MQKATHREAHGHYEGDYGTPVSPASRARGEVVAPSNPRAPILFPPEPLPDPHRTAILSARTERTFPNRKHRIWAVSG